MTWSTAQLNSGNEIVTVVDVAVVDGMQVLSFPQVDVQHW